MITSIEIQYITLFPPGHKHIVQIGGEYPNGMEWKVSVKKARKAIKRKLWNFHVKVNDAEKKVVTMKLPNGTKSPGVLADDRSKRKIPLPEIIVSLSNDILHNYN